MINNNYTTTQKVFRILLGVMLLFTGTSHLTWAKQEFRAQVPHWVPLEYDVTVILSGMAELALGVALIFLGSRRLKVGLIAALFFIAIFPGNIAQYLNQIDAFGLDTDGKRLARLFMQPVLVAWALWSSGAWSAWRNKDQDRLT